jgi:hypothetical protein
VRTTLTLDDDVAARLQEEARREGRTFKEVVNETIRLGLAKTQAARSAPPFKVVPKDMQLRPGLNLDNIEELLDLIEGPMRR